MSQDPNTPNAPDDLVLSRTDPDAPRRRPPAALWIGGGVALAAVVGLSAAMAVNGGPPKFRSDTALDIEIAEVAPPPVPEPSGEPLEVLPPEMAAAAPSGPVLDLAEAAPEPRPEPETAEPPREREPPAVRIPANNVAPPSFDCRYARSRAELMVCADPGLAEADRRLDAAYRHALDVGVPAWRLERQQRRWLRAREGAAFEAPEEVAGVYEARIAELQALADGAPPFAAGAPPEPPRPPPAPEAPAAPWPLWP